MPKAYRYIFGPVPSRRLGLSVGVDLVVPKVCTFDCVYCECGRTTVHTDKRGEYVPYEEVMRELESFLAEGIPFHYITFSGCGEPTLNVRMGDIARWIKEHVERPLALLTNSSLFTLDEVREAAGLCDLVLPSLDAVSEEVFKRINRPCCGIRASDVVEALRLFRREHPQVKMALEILFVKGYNDSLDELKLLKRAVDYIDPHEVHLNTVDRPPAEDVEPVSEDFLVRVRDLFGERAKVVGFESYSVAIREERLREAIVGVVSRRPLRVGDIARLLGEDVRRVSKVVESMKREGLLREERFKGEVFFRCAG